MRGGGPSGARARTRPVRPARRGTRGRSPRSRGSRRAPARDRPRRMPGSATRARTRSTALRGPGGRRPSRGEPSRSDARGSIPALAEQEEPPYAVSGRRRSSPSTVAGSFRSATRRQRRGDVVQVTERLVRHALLVEPHGQAPPGEPPLRCERHAAVGDAVADVDERIEAGDGSALAALAAHVAERPVAERRAPARGVRGDAVRDDARLRRPPARGSGRSARGSPPRRSAGRAPRRAPRSPDGHGRARAGSVTTSASGAVTVAISREIASSSVSRRPSSSSSAPNNSGSPKRSLTM